MEQVDASGSWRGATFHDPLLRSMGGGAACSRSLCKAMSWRITGSIDTFVISFFITGRLTIAGPIAAVEMFTKIALYYGHERAWAAIRWGQH
jgi:uncharacterized membrane protein